jgi:hypothetical protein
VVPVWFHKTWEVRVKLTIVLLWFGLLLVASAGCSNTLDRTGWHLDFGATHAAEGALPEKEGSK